MSGSTQRGQGDKANESLLQPSLTRGADETTVYSVLVGVLATFFGGAFAPIFWAVANSIRLRRNQRDWLVHAALFIVSCTALWAIFGHSPWRESIRETMGTYSPRVLTQVIGFAVFGCEYRLHRTEHRHAVTFGVNAPDGRAVGVGCAVASILLQMGLIVWVTR